MSKVLVIVDFQKDFYDKENGTLYVNGAENIVDNICNEIRVGKYDKIILTLDWHGNDDQSFITNGGIWPVHCVQGTDGAKVHPSILNTIIESRIPFAMFYKGDVYDHEEYGAFENISETAVNDITLDNFGKNSPVRIEFGTEFVVCGLAGDYCVWETFCRLSDFNFKVKPFYDGIAFIGEPFNYEKKWKEKIGLCC